MATYNGAAVGSTANTSEVLHVYDDVMVGGAAAVQPTGDSDPDHRTAIAGAVLTLVAKDSTGAPLPGLTPTWTTYKNAVTNSPQSQPAISPIGASGSYKFALSGSNPAGIIDLGAGAVPRYVSFSAQASVWVFAAFDSVGVPLPGLTPTWSHLRYVSDGTSYTPQPSFSELGNGLYKTTFLAARVTGIIDLGSTAIPRYLRYDTDRPVVLLPISE